MITIPDIATSLPITISYINAIDSGISGLDHVELWYEQGESGTWIDSGLTKTTASGSFSFNLAEDSDNYYFDLIAVDKAGNRSEETEETETPVAYDVDAPTLASVSVDASVTGGPITITYTGAEDIGPAGFKRIELWRKKEATGAWTNTGLSSTTENGSFDFIPTALAGNYYFDFVLEDNFGNRSDAAAGEGVAVVAYTAAPFSATLSTLPDATTELKTASITVSGTDITAYKFKLDAGAYGDETPVTTKISLSNLTLGTHNLSVVGKNSLGQWQATTAPTTYSWTIVAPPPAPTAVLSTLPDATTELKTASITVGGTDITVYKFKLDAGVYGNEIPVTSKINLANLAVGQHILNVIGKNNLNIWQAESSPTAYSWTVLAPPPPPEEEVADEGEGEEIPPPEEEQPPAEEETPPEEEVAPPEEEAPTGGEETKPEAEVSADHCENTVMDGDEEDINCGGSDCPACIDVNFSIKSRPMGRTPGNYGQNGSFNLFSRLSGQTIRTTDVSLDNDGTLDFLFSKIPANTYHIGLKSNGYLQKIVNDVALIVNNMTSDLDFTLGGTFSLVGGDVFNDNIINSFDLALMLYNYLEASESIDLNRDGLVNAADLALVLKNYQMKGDTP